MKKVILIATLFFSVCMFANAQKSVKVAAAANLRDVFMEIKEAYEKENPGVKIDVTFGSSGNFVQQILNGASFDFFMAADKSFPLKLQNKEATYGKVSTYIYGKLAVWSNTIDVKKGLDVLKTNAVKRISVANPETAPYGERAIELLKKQNIYDEVKAKIIEVKNLSEIKRTARVRVGDNNNFA